MNINNPKKEVEKEELKKENDKSLSSQKEQSLQRKKSSKKSSSSSHKNKKQISAQKSAQKALEFNDINIEEELPAEWTSCSLAAKELILTSDLFANAEESFIDNQEDNQEDDARHDSAHNTESKKTTDIANEDDDDSQDSECVKEGTQDLVKEEILRQLTSCPIREKALRFSEDGTPSYPPHERLIRYPRDKVTSYDFQYSSQPPLPPTRARFVLCDPDDLEVEECREIARCACLTAYTSMEIIRGRLSECQTYKHLRAIDVQRAANLRDILKSEKVIYGSPQEKARLLPTYIVSIHSTALSKNKVISFINIRIGKEPHIVSVDQVRYGSRWDPVHVEVA